MYRNNCGKFCIAVIKKVNSKSSYNDFISQFDFVKLYKNDEIVKIYFIIGYNESYLTYKTYLRNLKHGKNYNNVFSDNCFY